MEKWLQAVVVLFTIAAGLVVLALVHHAIHLIDAATSGNY